MKNRIEGDLSGKEEVLRNVGLYFKQSGFFPWLPYSNKHVHVRRQLVWAIKGAYFPQQPLE